ncbi:MAG TPA: hypothetical protein VGI61_09680 [Parafilimonas sp.]
MKKVLLLIIAAISFSVKNIYAQCNFTPTIVPNGVVFCPDETDTLATQVYDTYQWHKNGNPIAGRYTKNISDTSANRPGIFF